MLNDEPIFELDLSSDPKQMCSKFQNPISLLSEGNVITTDGRTCLIDFELYADHEYIYHDYICIG